MIPVAKTLICLLLAAPVLTSTAQDADSLLNQLGSGDSVKAFSSTFKSTRVVLSHSTETQNKYDLDLRIRHHFGDIGGEFGNSHTLFGLDGATDLYIGLDYGLSDKLTIGIGRSKHDELYNLFVKRRILEQNEQVPLSATVLGQGGWITRKETEESEFSNLASRASYFFQAIIARRFSDALSLEILPGYLIRKTVEDPEDNKGMFTAGLAGRLKLSKRLSFIADYNFVNISRSDALTEKYYNPLGVGLEIETGGHIFSLNFMNSEYIIENNFLPGTKKSWTNGGVRFGFTISRNFTLHKSKNPDIESKIY